MITKYITKSGISQKQEFQESKIFSKGVSSSGNNGEINFSDEESRGFSDIPTIQIDNANIRINENCHIIDLGLVENATIDIAGGIEVFYTYIGPSETLFDKQYRHIKIGKDCSYIGTGILLDSSNIEIITEICGDNAHSILDILALATSGSNISVEGVARVDSPYRQVSARVNQTNILIGHGARVRGVPKLEIATEDIEGGILVKYTDSVAMYSFTGHHVDSPPSMRRQCSSIVKYSNTYEP